MALVLSSLNLLASEVEIVSAQAECNKQHECVFRVTLKHADSGWDHYANGWQVVDADGAVLVKRVLYDFQSICFSQMGSCSSQP